MIFLEPELLGWGPLYKSWLKQLPEGFGPDLVAIIDDLVNWLIPPMLEFVTNEAQVTTPTQEQNLVRSCLRTFRVLLKMFDEDKTKIETLQKEISAILDGVFLFSLIWSV